MNLRSIDLNLLVILDALLDEAHVSRAAGRLGLTQPAVSAALQRCRDLFGDTLLERGRGLMKRTPRAEALRGPLKAVLAQVHGLVDPPDIPLKDIRQTVRIVLADHVAALLLPDLLRLLGETAPGIDLAVRPWRGAHGSRADLLSGEADLALSIIHTDTPGLDRQLVLDEHYVVAMRRDHPAARDFGLDRWLAYPHILVSGSGDRHGPLDDRLAQIGQMRRIGLVVPSFQLVPGLLLASDFIAMMPAHSIPAAFAGQIAVHVPPVAVDGFAMHLAWPTRLRDDKAVQHVLELLAGLLAAHVAAAPVLMGS